MKSYCKLLDPLIGEYGKRIMVNQSLIEKDMVDVPLSRSPSIPSKSRGSFRQFYGPFNIIGDLNKFTWIKVV
jgi:hypothetical protein